MPPGVGFLNGEFVNITGDTMTGDLTMNGGNIVMTGTETVDGIDISAFIDQDVSSGSTPTLTGTNFTGIPDSALDLDYVEVTGDTMIGTNSTTFFQIQQADNTVVFNVDTTNAQTIFNGVVDKDAIVLKDGSTKRASLLWGTNTVTLDIFSEEPTNKITNGTFETDLTGWDIGNTEENNANGDWILVPGDPDFGTGGAFYAMKYEAKYDSSGDGQGNTAVEASAVANSGLGLDYRDLTFDSAKVVSTANGAPIVHITQTQAISACPTGYHLITNDEWMTIARNVEAQTANWADGVIGSTVAAGGGLYRGNVGEATSVGYNASTDPDYGTGRDEKAKLVLSNGNEVWDLSGNVWDWTSGTIMGVDKPVGNPSAWVEWTTVTDFNGTGVGNGDSDDYLPSNNTWNADHGVGRYYQGSASGGPYAFRRGARWGDTAYAGVFAVSLAGTPANQNYSLGFRCASDSVDISQSTSIKYSGASSMKIDNGSPIDTRIVQSANVGDTSTYTLIAYAYTDGSAVTSADLELWYDSAVLETNYTSVGGGWYMLSGTLTGVASSKNYGVEVKADKTVYVDNLSLQAGVGTTQTFNVKNSGTGTVQTNFEDTVTFNDATGTNKAIVVKAHATQVANLQEWQNSAGTALTVVDKDGNVGIGVTDPDTKLEIFKAGNQLKLSFDATDNAIFAVDTNGDLTISPSGSNFIIPDAKNIVLNTTTGTKIGTATGQKLAFYGSTPIVQAVLATGAGATVDNVITALQNLGLVKQS